MSKIETCENCKHWGRIGESSEGLCTSPTVKEFLIEMGMSTKRITYKQKECDMEAWESKE